MFSTGRSVHLPQQRGSTCCLDQAIGMKRTPQPGFEVRTAMSSLHALKFQGRQAESLGGNELIGKGWMTRKLNVQYIIEIEIISRSVRHLYLRTHCFRTIRDHQGMLPETCLIHVVHHLIPFIMGFAAKTVVWFQKLSPWYFINSGVPQLEPSPIMLDSA